MNKRNSAIDFARGLVAICVVIGHLTKGKAGTFIFSFHMPFFFILSGYLFKDKLLDEGIFRFIKRKALHLLIPLFVYRAIGILFGIYAKERTIKSILMALFWTPGAGYFFSSLFVAVIILWCFAWIARLIEKKYVFCLYSLTMVILVTVAIIYYEAGWHDYYLIPIRLDTTLLGIVFCMIGYVFSAHRSVFEAEGGVNY